MFSESGMTDQAYLVTGASSGVGRSLAELLGVRGAKVAVQGRDAHRLKEAAAQVDAAGGEGLPVNVDLADPTAAAKAVEETVTAFGRLDGLVLNASQFIPAPFEQATLAELDEQWRVNVVSHFALVQAALPHLRPGAAIVFVSSTVAHAGFAACSTYATTKGAVEALARTLAIELAPRSIRVNTVAPGFVRTPMLHPHLEAIEGYEDALNDKTPVGRIGEPQEVAVAIAFLLSPEAAYICGTTVVVDGGWTAQ